MSESPPPAFNRWFLFIMVAIAGILALVDRQIISVLKPTMAAELGWSDDDYGTLGAWFQGAMAVSLLAAGPLVDRIAAQFPQAQRVRGDRFASVAQGLGLHARAVFAA